MEISTLAYNTIITHAYGFYMFLTVGWSFPGLPMTIQKKEIHFAEKVPNKVEMQDAQKHLQRLKTT